MRLAWAMTTAVALAALPGCGGSDEKEVREVAELVSRNAPELCEHLTDRLLDQVRDGSKDDGGWKLHSVGFDLRADPPARPEPVSEHELAAYRAVERFLAAVADEDGKAACRLMSGRYVRRLLGAGRDCASAIGRREWSRVRDQTGGGAAESVAGRGRRASVFLSNGRTVHVLRSGGRFVVDSIHP